MIDPRRVAENLAAVQARIAAAAARSGRTAADVTLVAVTKYADTDFIRALAAAGCRDVGESRPQQLWSRAAELAVEFSDGPLRWHLIGHLQRNKVERTLPVASLIHSCDSVRLAAEIDRAARAAGREPVAVLIEVNISADPAKHGFDPAQVAAALRQIAAFPLVRVRGLMAMAGRAEDPVAARDDFRRLRLLRDALQADGHAEVELAELSMGMSGDYEVAVEEGATIVRVGSALVEGAVVNDDREASDNTAAGDEAG